MTDCPRCQVLEEENRLLRAELDRRETVMLPPPREEQPTVDDLPRPSLELCGCDCGAIADLDACLPIDSQEGP